MFNKKVVTEENYKQIVLKRMIILCWILLLICFVIKIFGGNFFTFIGENDVANYIINNVYLLTGVQFIFYFIGTYVSLLIVFKDKFKKLNIIFVIIMFTSKALCNFGYIPEYLAMIIELIFLIVLPIIVNPKDWYFPIMFIIEIVIFQYISMFTKNIGLVNFPDNQLAGFVFMIDYYIMLFLSYLYLKKEKFVIMMLGILFLSNDKTQLEAYKKVLVDRHNAKITKLNDKHNAKVAKIDAKINKAKK